MRKENVRQTGFLSKKEEEISLMFLPEAKGKLFENVSEFPDKRVGRC